MKKLTTLSLLALTTIASAEQFYVTAEAGRGKLNEQLSIQKQLTPITILDKATPFGRIAFGYMIMDNLRAEIDFTNERAKNTYLAQALKQNYLRLAAKDKIEYKTLTVSDKFVKNSFGLSVIYDFDLFQDVTGFAGVRVGFAKSQYTGAGEAKDGKYDASKKEELKELAKKENKVTFSTVDNVLSTVKASAKDALAKTNPEVGFVIGANYNIDPNFAFGVAYRFNISSESNAKASDLINRKDDFDAINAGKTSLGKFTQNKADDSKIFTNSTVKSYSSSLSLSVTYKF